MKKLRQYPSYVDSKVEWLRNIPSHWEVVKSKRIFIESSIKGFPDEELLAATQTKGVIPKSLYENTTVTATKNFETLKLVEMGDFVISLRSFQGGIEYAHYRGIISPAYTILKPQEEVTPKYYRYLLKSKRYISGLTLLVTGIREGQNIDTSKFKDSYLPLPPKEEQTNIANFLDYKTEKINRFIKKKKHLIKLLKEQKAAIINQAVTKGLNQNIAMKESGIEWLGEIPNHWKLDKLSRLLKPKGLIRGPFGSALKTSFFVKKGYKVYEQKNAIYKDLTLGDSYIDSEKFEELKRFEVKLNDFLMSCSGTIGELHQVKGDFKKGIINQAMMIMRMKKIIHPDFFIWLFRSEYIKTTILDSSKGSAMKNLVGINEFKAVKIPVLPLDEQKEIVSHLEYETEKVNKTISTIQKEITLVEEYKKALIAEAVTGKIDVRDFHVPLENKRQLKGAEATVN
ncbi:restriction endonuclease subunit S [uncultured Christiangramia sp.]|uniref:restriction endonuclease subunit S n=1 Tax=uncultured Christiangramia sp. TaxID=503836 RepID=UPI00260B0B10|nr:restriction endonuclease subunit S [uncultured Christiangramia sp.]